MTSSTQKVLQYPSKSSCAFKQFPHSPKGIKLIVLSAALIGVTMVLTKGALEHLPPLTLISIQTAASVSFFWAIVLLQGIQVPLNWSTLKAASAGLFEPGLSYIFGIFGLSLTTASNSTFISTTEPVMTIALSWLILRERISSSIVILGLLACVGVALMIGSPDASSIGQGSVWGNLLTLLSVLFAALYSIATQRSINYIAPVLLAAIQQSVALILFTVMMLGALVFRLEVIEFTEATWKSLIIAVLSGAFGYGLAFLLYLCALRYHSASRISLYLTLVPIFGAIAAYLLLGERLALSQGFGGALVLLVIVGISQLPDQKSC